MTSRNELHWDVPSISFYDEPSFAVDDAIANLFPECCDTPSVQNNSSHDFMLAIPDDYAAHRPCLLCSPVADTASQKPSFDSEPSSSSTDNDTDSQLAVSQIEELANLSGFSLTNAETCRVVSPVDSRSESPVNSCDYQWSHTHESSSFTPDTDPDASTTRSPAPAEPRKHVAWSKEEHDLFLLGLRTFKGDENTQLLDNGKPSVGLGPGVAAKIAAMVKTRTPRQVRSYAQKHFLRQAASRQ